MIVKRKDTQKAILEYKIKIMNDPYYADKEKYIMEQIEIGHKAFLKNETNGDMSDIACNFYLIYKKHSY